MAKQGRTGESSGPSGKSSGRHDYAALGFQCGLEIHQQLDTGKLFCRCKSDVIDLDEVRERTEFMLQRRLRPTESELGELDPAARAEAQRGLLFRYHGIQGHSCLVDADEEPPHEPDADAIDIVLTLAGLVDGRPVDEIQFMRKIVIDGSNTTGFQRTGLVALGGAVEGVPIWTMAVEEDSCRKLDEDEDGVVHYTLDRLGIPLIEIATGPQIRDPDHAKRTAARLGALLRATGRVRRGLGTIRQDLNVSIAAGDRVEIKGVQDLRAIPRVIDNEIDRQLHMAKVREQLGARGVDAGMIDNEAPIDLSDAFADCDSKVIKGALKRGDGVWGVRLPRFAGLIQGATKDGPRLGREFAGYAKKAAGVRGVFHSDEMPAYGITEAQVAATRDALGLDEQDGFVLAAERPDVAKKALVAVQQRAVAALGPLPREVRNALPDDHTGFLRPLPGAARMYPETDVAPVPVTEDHWERILADLPERPEDAIDRVTTERGLSREIVVQLVEAGETRFVETLPQWSSRPADVARFRLQIVPELASNGTDTSIFDPGHGFDTAQNSTTQILGALEAGRFAKEALADVATAYVECGNIEAAIEAAGAGAVDTAEVETIIAKIVADRADFVKQRGKAAAGPLMGEVMKELRGKADGKLVSQVLAKEIAKHEA